MNVKGSCPGCVEKIDLTAENVVGQHDHAGEPCPGSGCFPLVVWTVPSFHGYEGPETSRTITVQCHGKCPTLDRPVRCIRQTQQVKDGKVYLAETYACLTCFPEAGPSIRKEPREEVWFGFKEGKLTPWTLDYEPVQEIVEAFAKHGITFERYVRGPAVQQPSQDKSG